MPQILEGELRFLHFIFCVIGYVEKKIVLTLQFRCLACMCLVLFYLAVATIAALAAAAEAAAAAAAAARPPEESRATVSK